MAKPGEPSWGRSTIGAACPLDCPDTCSLAVSVDQGRVVKIDGSDRHDVTAGFICSKVRRFGELRPRLASLQVHPIDAEARDLSTGNVTRVFNALGEIHCPVTLNPDMKP